MTSFMTSPITRLGMVIITTITVTIPAIPATLPTLATMVTGGPITAIHASFGQAVIIAIIRLDWDTLDSAMVMVITATDLNQLRH